MTVPLTSVTGESGANGVALLFNSQLQWICRTLSGPDFGIDAQVELLLGGRPSGRVIALQIKAGASQFAEKTPAKDGWVFRDNGLRAHARTPRRCLVRHTRRSARRCRVNDGNIHQTAGVQHEPPLIRIPVRSHISRRAWPFHE
ncbi:DUF4365 domain-containing protein [Amycolatopsis sp. A133]|uniref:DUF4365 domain-containing protein n=1 Tax=Amycolatopsis sp. A133 TaxID=3064472 RepID=UPI0027F99644|nr:DUF4365 domain-containing protein [Amycolatopsis sp. A133]MDQ7808263.1 DUF4365 domain-containing protein [Amycolatopsis sp. A133]